METARILEADKQGINKLFGLMPLTEVKVGWVGYDPPTHPLIKHMYPKARYLKGSTHCLCFIEQEGIPEKDLLTWYYCCDPVTTIFGGKENETPFKLTGTVLVGIINTIEFMKEDF